MSRSPAGAASAQRLYEETRRIFKQRARIDIRGGSPYLPPVRVLDGRAPEYALNINRSIAHQFFGEIDGYFDRNSDVTHSSVSGRLMDAAGYGEPIHVFIVNSLSGAEGKSYGFPKDHVIVDRSARRTTIAHEIGHQCGLVHNGDGNNLMHPTNDGDELNRWQVAAIRNSRYATFFNDGR